MALELSELSRRRFCQATAAGGMSVGLGTLFSRTARAEESPKLEYSTATQTIAAIQDRSVSSGELVNQLYERIAKHNPAINAFVTLNEEQARKRAQQADEALAKGESWGRLHGLPIVIKDSFQTKGLKTTSGSKLLSWLTPAEDAPAVARLKAEGAIILGKTNLPEFASDVQSFNEVAGTTNNPWDLSRTPGGSTGGGAAALAAGFAFLELGSDIGGSIRTPAHFCGVFGHKPTLNIVPLEGHIPPPPGGINATDNLPVAGPLARSAADLKLQLEIIAGPVDADALGYSWRLPPSRKERLKDFKIGYVLDDPFCPVTDEVRDPLEQAVDQLRKAGAELVEGWPPGIKPQKIWENYFRLLAAFMVEVASEEDLAELEQMPEVESARLWLEGSRLSHRDWQREAIAQKRMRQQWQGYYQTFDCFLSPENFTVAIEHDQEEKMFNRKVATPQGPRGYIDLLKWISPATLTGCPATVAPLTALTEGLPVGIQIMGPYMEDATPLKLAELLEQELGGFQPPPEFPA